MDILATSTMLMVPDQSCVEGIGGDNGWFSSTSTSFNLEDIFESSEDWLGKSSDSIVRGGVGIVTVELGTSWSLSLSATA